MMRRREFLALGAGALFAQKPAKRPNVIFFLVDDPGYGDFGVNGNHDVPTPNMDSLARDGVLFEQFCVASPVCSPSRVAFTTGQFPARNLINSYLNDHKSNQKLGMRDWLDPKAPCVARAFKDAGYSTGHFGKWHMGGGRDVGEAPLPQAYGFEESVTSFEGLGDRLLIENDNLSKQSAALGRGNIVWAPKHKLTEMYIDRALDFIKRNREKPFYVHVWPCDVHDEHLPTPAMMAKYDRFASDPPKQKYYAVLDEMDRQIGRFLKSLDEMGVADNTIFVLTGDNGPTAWPRYYRNGGTAPGSTGGLRGRKWSLYEGGVREPLFIRWKDGKLPAGHVDRETICCGVDFFPTVCGLAGVKMPAASFDGEDLSQACKGKPQKRKHPLMFEYGRTPAYLYPGKADDKSPNLAIRDGRWKLLVNDDGSNLELYDFSKSDKERDNVASQYPDVAKRLSSQVIAWRKSLPVLE
jgi:arylsulfatase A-like enzyme